MAVICSKAGESKHCRECLHSNPHDYSRGCCVLAGCGTTGWEVECIPAGLKRASSHTEDLATRLKNQIERTEATTVVQNVEVSRCALENQILIMKALAALLEAK